MSAPALLTNAPRRLSPREARRIFLSHHGLLAPPWPAPTTNEGHLGALGFVQVDSICTVMRAHDMILSARHKPYRPAQLSRMVARDRTAFEHWTHDAAILPMAAYPHWRHKMARDAERLLIRWKSWRREGFEQVFDTVLRRIEAEGSLSSADVGEDEKRSSGGWWDWHPSKTALEYLWRRGDLAVTRREGFRKLYDLTERVIPPRPHTALGETLAGPLRARSSGLDLPRRARLPPSTIS